MATHVATNQTNSPPGVDSKNIPPEHPGASYAHAVLNFKQPDNSNKENINESTIKESIEPQQPQNKINLINDSSSESTKEITESSSLDDGGGGFTPVINHSRKERKNERNKKNRETQSNRISNGNNEKRDNTRETPASTNRENINRESIPDKEELINKKVFVEAPLPTVNPWQKKNATVVTSKETEKRILQPQKQPDLVPNGQSTRPPKEKRKNNQKVKCPLLLLNMHVVLPKFAFY